MSIILNIDTSAETASISLARSGIILHSISNGIQKDHASFLHKAVDQLLRSAGIKITDLSAIGVTSGPGSYTGIRVGMASAKGFCIALNNPLITLNTLEIMAQSVIKNTKDKDILFCPMIDARRMEVYTAVYDHDLKTVKDPCAMILDEMSFNDLSSEKTILFFGSGSSKWKSVVKLRNSAFHKDVNLGEAMAEMTFTHYLSKSFTDVVYSEPFYLKEFFDR